MLHIYPYPNCPHCGEPLRPNFKSYRVGDRYFCSKSHYNKVKAKDKRLKRSIKKLYTKEYNNVI